MIIRFVERPRPGQITIPAGMPPACPRHPSSREPVLWGSFLRKTTTIPPINRGSRAETVIGRPLGTVSPDGTTLGAAGLSGHRFFWESCGFMVSFIWVSCEEGWLFAADSCHMKRAHGDAGQVRRPRQRGGAVHLRRRPRPIAQARFSVKKCVMRTLFFKENGHAAIQVERTADAVRFIGHLSDTYRTFTSHVR